MHPLRGATSRGESIYPELTSLSILNIMNHAITFDFPLTLEHIDECIDQIDPVKYGKTRNYIDGDVTYLSPYISR